MPINCLINCPINSVQFVFKKQINGFLMNQFMDINVSKRRSFRPSSLLLSLFNTRPANTANSLKTKELRKRHFWLKILSQGKPLRLKTLGTKFAQYFSHFPADPTLHMPPKPPLHAMPRNPTLCKVSCRICRPNHTHLTPLIIKL